MKKTLNLKKSPIGWLPAEWNVVPLGSVAVKIGSGITPKGGESSYLPSGIPLVRSQNILWGKLDLSGVAFISEEQHDSMSGTKVQMGDVLLNITGASIGRACIFEVKNQEANVNQHVCIIRSNGRLESLFLCNLLISPIGQRQIDSYQGGGNREGLNFEQIRNFYVPLPPLPEQRKIAAILSTWDRAHEKTEALIEAKRRLKSGLMQLLLVGKSRFSGLGNSEPWKKAVIGRIPKSWNVTEFREILSARPTYGANASAVEYDSSTTYRYVRITDIDDAGNLIEVNKMGIHRKEADGCFLKKDDVLIARTGNTVGKSFLCRNESESMAFAGYLIRFRLNPEKAAVEYIWAFLHSKIFWNWVKNTIKVGAQPNINSEEYQRLPIPLPPLSEQKRIADCLGTLDREITLLMNKAAKFREQKNGLMQNLLAGVVRVKV